MQIEIDFHKGQETKLYGKWRNQGQMITRIYDMLLFYIYMHTHICILIYVCAYIEGGGERASTCAHQFDH